MICTGKRKADEVTPDSTTEKIPAKRMNLVAAAQSPPKRQVRLTNRFVVYVYIYILNNLKYIVISVLYVINTVFQMSLEFLMLSPCSRCMTAPTQSSPTNTMLVIRSAPISTSVPATAEVVSTTAAPATTDDAVPVPTITEDAVPGSAAPDAAATAGSFFDSCLRKAFLFVFVVLVLSRHTRIPSRHDVHHYFSPHTSGGYASVFCKKKMAGSSIVWLI